MCDVCVDFGYTQIESHPPIQPSSSTGIEKCGGTFSVVILHVFLKMITSFTPVAGLYRIDLHSLLLLYIIIFRPTSIPNSVLKRIFFDSLVIDPFDERLFFFPNLVDSLFWRCQQNPARLIQQRPYQRISYINRTQKEKGGFVHIQNLLQSRLKGEITNWFSGSLFLQRDSTDVKAIVTREKVFRVRT